MWRNYHLPPYIGSWDVNFPGIFIVHFLEQEIFGETIIGFRLFDFFFQLISLCFLYYLSKRVSGSSVAGFLSCLYFSIFYINEGFFVGDRENYVFSFLLASVALGFLLEKRVFLRAVVVGLFLGFAFMIRPTFGLSLLIFGSWFLWEGLKNKNRFVVFVEALIFALSFSFIFLVFISLYLSRGYFNELKNLILYHLKIYTNTRPPLAYEGVLFSFFNLLSSVFQKEPILVFSVILAIFVRSRAQENKLFLILIFMIIMSLLSYLFQGGFAEYHLVPFWNFLMVLSGISWSWIGNQLKARRGFSSLFYLSLIVLIILNLSPDRLEFVLRYGFRNFEKAYSSGLGSSLDKQLSYHYLTAEYLKPLLREDDKIEVFARTPLIPYLLKKKLPSRFSCVQHLVYSSVKKETSPLQRQWIIEYTSAVLSARPRFFIITDEPFVRNVSLSVPFVRQALIEKFPELVEFLKKNYKLRQKFGTVEIYEYEKTGI